MKQLFEDLNIFKHCRKLDIELWSCPRFVFLIMGSVIVVSIIGAYYVTRQYIDPEIVIAIVTFLTAFLLVIMYVIVNAFERIVYGRQIELLRTKEILELKDQFVYIAVHDLSSSATAIKWGLKTVEPKLANLSPLEKEMFKSIRERNEQLINLVRRILLIVRIESGSMGITITPIDVRQTLEAIIDEVRHTGEEQGGHIESVYPAQTFMLATDPTQLREIMLILLKSAIKHMSATNGQILLSVMTQNATCVITITHNGTMISEEHQAHFFEKFWRDATENKIEGSSFGMYIAKQLTEMLGGTLGFTSTPEKTTFTLTLPLGGKADPSGKVKP